MHRIFFIISFLLIPLILQAQESGSSDFDSLFLKYYSLDDNDIQKLEVCKTISCDHPSLDTNEVFARRLIELSKTNNNAYYLAQGYQALGFVKYMDGDYQASLDTFRIALLIADSLKNPSLSAVINRQMARDFSYMLNFTMADKYYNKALEYYQQVGDTSNLSLVYAYLAMNYSDQRMWQKSEELFQLSIRLDSLQGDEESMSFHYQDLGDLYIYHFLLTRGKCDSTLLKKAKYCFHQAMSLYYDDPYCQYSVCFSLAYIIYHESLIYNYQGDKLNDAIEAVEIFYNDGSKALQMMDSDSESLLFEFTKVNLLLMKRKYSEAKTLLDSLNKMVEDGGDCYIDKLLYLYSEWDYYYSAVGDYKNACIYKAKFYEYCNDVLSMDYAVATTQQLAENHFNALIHERDERERKAFRVMMYWVVGLVVFLVFGFWEYFRKRRHNRLLNEKNTLLTIQREEILSQKEEIQAQSEELIQQNEQITLQNTSITDSINYASLIQKAVLPKDSVMRELFADYFVFYRPLHIVAGDFYWASRIGKWSVLVCADCTGHGVPGAFVSMLGVSLLNEICPSVISSGGNAADVLNELRQKLMYALGQDRTLFENGERVNMDGMDLSLIMLDRKAMMLNFAGAYRPLWQVREGELIQHRPDKMPIGLYVGKEQFFQNHVVELRRNDMLYMFSDGIPDQFGFTDSSQSASRHFSVKKLAALLQEIYADSMTDQCNAITNAVDNWRNGYRQLDDNILVGVRI